jgi:hypothetical protein
LNQIGYTETIGACCIAIKWTWSPQKFVCILIIQTCLLAFTLYHLSCALYGTTCPLIRVQCCSFFHFCAAIAELLDIAIDKVIVEVQKYTKIKNDDKYGYFAFASFEVNVAHRVTVLLIFL